MSAFESLSTSIFQTKMKKHALAIYETIFPGCRVEDLRENGCKVHVLDKEFSIDSLLHFKSGQWVSIQEKYRKNEFLTNKKNHTHAGFPDFTQEVENATGTPHHSPGEWYKLAAQLYFYGWANQDCSGFDRWVLIDIPRYKILVEAAGGIDKFGLSFTNKDHGRSTFIAFPIYRLESCLVLGSPDCLKKHLPKEAKA